MEMTIYERDSYHYSLSNLAMLKAFHDEGVNVHNFSVNSFMVDVNSSMDATYEILIQGTTALFEEVRCVGYGEEDKEYGDFLHEEMPENSIIIKDAIFSQGLKHKYKDELFKAINQETEEVTFSDTNFVVLPDHSGIAILVFFPGMVHEIALSLTKIRRKGLEIMKKNGE